jgi:2-phosphosulfolactate phosphatase
MRNRVVIDCYQENPEFRYDGYAIVAIDVIRATTTAITAVATGRRCFPVPTEEAAKLVKRKHNNALLAGEVAGKLPDEFEVNNSPAELSMRMDTQRPLVLLSSSGTKLIHATRESDFTYLSCFRNHAITAQHLIDHHSHVALIGAGTRGEFREEDQICCAWIARELIDAGFEPDNERTASIVEKWRTATVDACLVSRSAEYLLKSGQTLDLDFTLEHVNDLPHVYRMRDGEVIALRPSEKRPIQPGFPATEEQAQRRL